MKKKYVLLYLLILMIFPSHILASSKLDVTLNKCVDGDTAWFNLDGEKIKARFLAIDTPESTNKIEEYGKEASDFTCNLLTNASSIQIEYDDNADKEDKYNRQLVWVFVDNQLLQELVVKEGLAEVKYVYGDYKYLTVVNAALDEAKENKLNLWSDSTTESNDTDDDTNITDYIIVGGGCVIIICLFIFNKKSRNKMIKQVKSKAKSQAKKQFKKSLNNLK